MLSFCEIFNLALINLYFLCFHYFSESPSSDQSRELVFYSFEGFLNGNCNFSNIITFESFLYFYCTMSNICFKKLGFLWFSLQESFPQWIYQFIYIWPHFVGFKEIIYLPFLHKMFSSQIAFANFLNKLCTNSIIRLSTIRIFPLRQILFRMSITFLTRSNIETFYNWSLKLI